MSENPLYNPLISLNFSAQLLLAHFCLLFSPQSALLLVTDFGCSIFSFCKNSKFSLKPTGTHDDGCRFQGWMREQAAGKAGGLLDDSFLWGAVARGHFVLLLPLGKSRTAHHRRRRKTELWPVSGKSCSTR